MACLGEILHITIQFLVKAGAHSWWNLFHITFEARMRFKSNAFSLKYSLQKIYHTYSGYLKLSEGNINRFFSKCALWSTREIKSFLWKGTNWNNSHVLKPWGYLLYEVGFFGSFKYRSSVYIGVYVHECYFCPREWFSDLETFSAFQSISERTKIALVTLFFGLGYYVLIKNPSIV